MAKTLPGMSDIPLTKSQLATKYVSSIKDKQVYKLHKSYFKEYLANGYAVIMAHIRNAYLKYVCSGEWSEEKFDEVLYVLVSNEQTLSNNAFENMGAEYDNGSIKFQKFHADMNNEKIETSVDDDMTDEELIKFLNGGA
jgi:hypothetical protein